MPQDHKVSARWYRAAADSGNRVAQLNLGVFYKLGLGVTADHREAVKYFRLAALQGDESAQLNLGISLMQGPGANTTAAIEWLMLAAKQGNAGPSV